MPSVTDPTMSERYLDDALLISRAQAGDRTAFNALVEKHGARAYQYAFRLCRNEEDASDIVSDGFLRVYNALANFKGQASFITWLYRIMTNCYLDRRKREKNRKTVSLEAVMQTDAGEMERQFVDPGLNPYQHAERGDKSLRIQEGVDELPDYQKAMIVMYHSELMSYDEIAGALDLPVGTVKSRLNRARLNLREILLKHEELFRS